MFAKLRTRAAMTTGRYSNLRRSNPTMSSNIHAKGAVYSAPQNIRESNGESSAISSNDSKIHSVEPSSFTYDHHRSPTSNRPEMFFTVQKSNASKMMQTTKMKMKLDVNQEPNMYAKRAKALKKR